MKYLKIGGIFLLVVIAVATVISFIAPLKQHIEKSIIVKASVPQVYTYLSKLENFNRFSIWANNDTTIKNKITGTDGQLGAYNTWIGEPHTSGEGKMEITELEVNSEIKHNITFLSPKKMEATSEFKLMAVNGGTKVIWDFDIATPRPSNIFNLFSSLEKTLGKDFEEGLKNMKTAIEKNSSPAKQKTYPVQMMNFPATTYAQVRQLISWNDIPSFFSKHISIIQDEAVKLNLNAATPVGLFYSWDEENKQTDMAAAMPVPAGTTIDNDIVQVINIPTSKAVYVDYYGAYAKATESYRNITQYLETNKLKQKLPAIHQYITDQQSEKDTSKWLTKIIYLVE